MADKTPGWRAGLVDAIDTFMEITSGYYFRVVLRMEWTDSPQWLTSEQTLRAKSRADAAAKAIVLAQKTSDIGWERVVIESVEMTCPPNTIGVVRR